jgi:hypothetical protein
MSKLSNETSMGHGDLRRRAGNQGLACLRGIGVLSHCGVSLALLCGGAFGCSGEGLTELASSALSSSGTGTFGEAVLDATSSSGGTTGTVPGSQVLLGGNAGLGGRGSQSEGGSSNSTLGSSTPPEIPSSFLLLSELKIDPPSTDGNQEYIELLGEPGKHLNGYFLVVIEADVESNVGQVDRVVNLSNCAGVPCRVGENGLLLFVAAEGAVPSGSAETRVEVLSALGRGALENGTGYFGVFRGVAPPSPGDDWDRDDDGQLEVPEGSVEQDGISWTDGGKGDGLYSATVRLGPKPLAAAAFRCDVERSSASWRYGELVGDASTLAPDLSRWIPAGLGDFSLSPGAANDCPPVKVPEPALGGAGGGSNEGGAAGNHLVGAGGTTQGSSPSTGGGSAATSVTNLPVVVRGSTPAAGGGGWWSSNPLSAGRSEGAGSGAPEQAGQGARTHGGESGQGGESASDRPGVPSGCSFHAASSCWSFLWGILGVAMAIGSRRGLRKRRINAPFKGIPGDRRRSVLA